MKKIIAICLMAMMLFGFGINAFAAPNGFYESPSGRPTPEIIEFDIPGCDGEIILTSYVDRNLLPDNLKTMIENAYKYIVNSDKVSDLNSDLEELAKSKGIDLDKLAVSDLFDLRVVGCDEDHHIDMNITLSADTLSHFVGLLHMKKDGEFELISNATVINNGEQLRFTVDELSPFAIVINTDAIDDSNKTGDNNTIYIYAIIMAACAAAIFVLTRRNKKQSI